MESGRLEDAPTAELCRRYADAAETGCLRIQRDGTQALIYFRTGNVYTATAPEARPRLGDRLVGAGHITEEQLAATLAYQRSLPQPRRIGELLIERGMIDRETMRTYVRDQIADSVAAALSWASGEWRFSPGEQVSEDVPLDMSVADLLMEGARRLEEFEIIRARLGSMDAIVDFSPEGQADLSLTPDEWSMLTHIDGRSTVAEIAGDAGYGQFEAARIIYGLLTAGVVSLIDDGLGYDEDQAEEDGAAEPSGRAEAPDPFAELAGLREADAEPSDAGTREEARQATSDVDRSGLLREFAELGDEESDEDEDTVAIPRPPPPPQRKTTTRPLPPPTPERPEKKGLFGRFKKS